MDLLGKIEAILFVASKPLSIKKLAKSLEVTEGKVEEALETLQVKFNSDASGIHIMRNEGEVQMSTNPEAEAVVKDFVRHEVTGELTKAQLETLTVVAYAGPITRPELEQIRGVNCSVILRNLLIRDLITEEDNKGKLLPEYQVSMNAMAHLGINQPSDLPGYADLHDHEHLFQAEQA